MSDSPFAKPEPLSADKLHEAQTRKVTFINPKGNDLYARSRGRSDDSGFSFDYERTERRKRNGLEQESLSVKGRPVK